MRRKMASKKVMKRGLERAGETVKQAKEFIELLQHVLERNAQDASNVLERLADKFDLIAQDIMHPFSDAELFEIASESSRGADDARKAAAQLRASAGLSEHPDERGDDGEHKDDQRDGTEA